MFAKFPDVAKSNIDPCYDFRQKSRNFCSSPQQSNFFVLGIKRTLSSSSSWRIQNSNEFWNRFHSCTYFCNVKSFRNSSQNCKRNSATQIHNFVHGIRGYQKVKICVMLMNPWKPEKIVNFRFHPQMEVAKLLELI